MTRFIAPIISISLLLLSQGGAGLSLGTGLPGGTEQLSSVIYLQDDQGGRCTGALVGLHPPTVITAKHCADSIPPTSDLRDKSVKAKAIVTLNSFSFGYLPGSQDIAILIFDEADFNSVEKVKEADVFTVAPVTLTWHQEVELCGFGKYEIENPQDRPFCAKNFLILENPAFQFQYFTKTWFPQELDDRAKSLRGRFDSLTPEEKVRDLHGLIQDHLQQFGPKTQMAISTFLSEAFLNNPTSGYDKNHAEVVTVPGDSGGPWFVESDDHQLHLVGITSSTIEHFSEASLAFRIDGPWVVNLFKKAVSKGADIHGFSPENISN